ncbi:MAG: ADP-heptose--LPS heptosyltransferase, partial [Chloroflexota bacterium]|nr:ADP-heptose--LPS heptosyltransferase [Chloroflexota bacterium]
MQPPTDRASAWLAAMRRGDFAAAWLISDRVLRERLAAGPCWQLPRHEQWVWDGRPLRDRRVLVRCYHGLGDTIQFARFLPTLADIAREVVVWAPRPLLRLLGGLRGVGRVLPLHDGAVEVDYDVDVEIMEPPHALRTSLATLPARVPYFDVPASPRRSARMSVGLVAASGAWDPSRSISATLLAGVIPAEVAAFSLQLGPPLPGATDLSTPDLWALAGRLRGRDLVITVDTMVAHLAGALGVPVWT